MKSSVTTTFILCSLLAGCATTSPPSSGKYTAVSPALAQTLRERGMRMFATPTPDFVRMTNGDQASLTVGIMFGAVGGGIGAAAVIAHARSAGRTIVAENQIADPTPRLVERIREMLVAKYASENSDSGLTVTVSTDNWALSKDAVVLDASVVIADAAKTTQKHPKPLAKGVCHYRSASGDDMHTAEALLADGAARLKSELDAALDHCTEEFRVKLFP